MNGINRSTLTLAVAILVGLALAAPRPVAAQLIFTTNFDPPTYVAGLPLVGQDGWNARDILSPNAAVISTAWLGITRV